jgi:hypothetical protein
VKFPIKLSNNYLNFKGGGGFHKNQGWKAMINYRLERGCFCKTHEVRKRKEKKPVPS